MRYFSHSAWLTALALGLAVFLPMPPSRADTTANNFDSNLNSLEVPISIPQDDNLGICTDQLEPEIDKIINRSELNQGKWAILVQSLGGTNIYSLNPDSYMIPASNVKLLVTAAALQRLSLDGQIRSTSVNDWIEVTNLRSNNAYANVLLSYLGGFESVEQALTGLGVSANGYRLRDGSGLSRSNLATPRTLVSTLRAMYHGRGNEVFLASLPVAGVSGTLKNRLHQTNVRGLVRAKTGTLKGVKALSGYMDHPEYGTLVFSIIANQPTTRSNDAVIRAIDDIVLSLSELTSCQ